MRKMQKTVQGQKFVITENADGSYKVWTKTCGKIYEVKCADFDEAGQEVHCFANNHDIAYAVERKMCDFFGKLFF